MSISKTSFAEVVTSAKLLYEGMANNLEELAGVGLDQALTTELDSQKKKVEDLNVRQEKLKADLKTATSELDAEFEKLGDMISRNRKLIKIELPNSKWKEFGIEAQH